MFGHKDIIDYLKTLVILTICFGIIGNNIYFENFDGIINNYNYYDEPLNSLFHKNYNNFILEGDHDYTFFFFVEGPRGANLNINMKFETLDDISFSYDTTADKTWFGVWGENKIYREPIYFPQNESINISIHLTTSSFVSGLHWQMLVYQDLPVWLTKHSLIIALITILMLVIWMIAYEQYEKIFADIEKQGRKSEKKTEEVKNV